MSAGEPVNIERVLDPGKYITFKRTSLHSALPEYHNTFAMLEVPDAVVILRRDVFAGPALHSYAACIAIVAKVLRSTDMMSKKAEELQKIADYFEDQAMMADEDNAAGLPSI